MKLSKKIIAAALAGAIALGGAGVVGAIAGTGMVAEAAIQSVKINGKPIVLEKQGDTFTDINAVEGRSLTLTATVDADKQNNLTHSWDVVFDYNKLITEEEKEKATLIIPSSLISSSLDPDGNMVVLTVSDDGPQSTNAKIIKITLNVVRANNYTSGPSVLFNREFNFKDNTIYYYADTGLFITGDGKVMLEKDIVRVLGQDKVNKIKEMALLKSPVAMSFMDRMLLSLFSEGAEENVDTDTDTDTEEEENLEEIDSEIKFDTSKKAMQIGDKYSVLLKKATIADKITVASLNPAVATVELISEDHNGRGMLYSITGVADGSVQITAKNDKGATLSTCDIKVGGYSLDTYNVNILPGNTYGLLAVNVPADDKVEFTTSNAGVATIALDRDEYTSNRGLNGQLWRVTAKALGSTTITGTYNNESFSFTVNVKPYWLDTTEVKIAPGKSYAVLAQNMTLATLQALLNAKEVTASDTSKVDIEPVDTNYTSGNKTGVLLKITAKETATGDTTVNIGTESVHVTF